MEKNIIGKVNSFQSFGTLDGPGVRFVVFMQGCPLRCGCCHNPETWDLNGGKEISAEEVLKKILQYKEYFSSGGGVTLSGGEPLMQALFAAELFKLCQKEGINTCLDTSGCILNSDVKDILEYTDYCLLDIKYTDDEKYRNYVGCTLSSPLTFLDYLNKRNIPTRLRQVIIKGLNDDGENIKNIAEIAKTHSCVKEIEFLPFKKLCIEKYKKLNLDFRLANYPETSNEDIEKLNKLLKKFSVEW